MGNSTLPFFLFLFLSTFTLRCMFFLLHVLAASSFVGTKHNNNNKKKIANKKRWNFLYYFITFSTQDIKNKFRKKKIEIDKKVPK